jgi:hypothetical protein
MSHAPASRSAKGGVRTVALRTLARALRIWKQQATVAHEDRRAPGALPLCLVLALGLTCQESDGLPIDILVAILATVKGWILVANDDVATIPISDLMLLARRLEASIELLRRCLAEPEQEGA